MRVRFLLLVSLAISIVTLAPPFSIAMEENEITEVPSGAPLLHQSTADNPEENSTPLDLRQALQKVVSELDGNGELIKIKEIDPKLIKALTLKYPSLKEGEPSHLFLILPQSLIFTTEERPQRVETAQKEESAADELRKKLNKILSKGQDVEENTALLSYRKLPKDRDQPSWDDVNAFMKELDRAFFNAPSSSKKVKAVKVISGFLGFTPPIPICGSILFSIGNIFGFPPGDWLSNSLSVWITVTLAPVSTRQLYERAGKIFDPSPFLTLKEDEERTHKATQKVIAQKTAELLKAKQEETALSREEKAQIRSDAQGEVGEPYRSNPHIFQKSKTHKVADVVLAFSSALNGSIPASLLLTIYQEYDKEVGFPWGVVFSVPVATYYALNYYDFGADRLWGLFSHYQYIGSGQSSEEDSRQKRTILMKRIEQFQEVIANPKFNEYVKTVYNEILKQKKELSVQNTELTTDEQISAFSLLMLMDKIRMEEDKALNFKKDLDVIKVSWIKDFLDNLTGGIVGAGFYADVIIVRSILKTIFQGPPFHWDEVTAEEQSAFYAVAFCDVSFRSVIEFKLHQNNLQSWLKAFSLKHLVDFQGLRKALGGVALGNAVLHSLPKFFIGWSAFTGNSLLTKLALLIPSTLINFSLNDAVFNKHYKGGVTDMAILKTEGIGIDRMRAHLKSWSDKAKELIGTRFDDETIDKMYSGIHKGM